MFEYRCFLCIPSIGCPKQTFSFCQKQAYIVHFLGQVTTTGVTFLSEILFYQWHLKCENGCSVMVQVIHTWAVFFSVRTREGWTWRPCTWIWSWIGRIGTLAEWLERGSEIFLGILETDNKVGGFSFSWKSETVQLLSMWPTIFLSLKFIKNMSNYI